MVGQTPGRQKRGATPAPASPFQFDLEKHLKDPSRRQEVLAKVDTRIGQLREQLRSGGSQEVFDHLTTLLNAFTGLKRVVERAAGRK
jgi:hypothetical protein